MAAWARVGRLACAVEAAATGGLMPAASWEDPSSMQRLDTGRGMSLDAADDAAGSLVDKQMAADGSAPMVLDAPLQPSAQGGTGGSASPPSLAQLAEQVGPAAIH
jgi:hypothetical protein